MFVASVWDWDKLQYDYYESPGERSIGGWNDKRAGLGLSGRRAVAVPVEKRAIGVTLEEILPVLPAGSKKTGSGVEAIGQIMVKGSATAMGDNGAMAHTAPKAPPSFFPFLFAAAAGGALATALASRTKGKDTWKWVLAGFSGFLVGGSLAWSTRSYYSCGKDGSDS